MAVRDNFHTRAKEQSYAWMDSPGDELMDASRCGHVYRCRTDAMRMLVSLPSAENVVWRKLTRDYRLFRLLSHWQAHHRHICPQGDRWHAQWLSINVSGRPGLCAPGTASMVSVNGVARSARSPQRTLLQCHVGLVPPGVEAGMAVAPLALMQIPVSGHVYFSSGDEVCDSWVTYLLLLSENASLLKEENMFPNKMQHGDRITYGMTLERAVRFVADPTVSEVRC